jgi:DNA polymerase I-like protein with 3'-5' exonuclease and polymerase domains
MFSFDMTIPSSVYVDTEEDARQWADYFHRIGTSGTTLGLDSETTGLNKQKDRIVAWSLSDGVHRICVPVKWLHIFKYVLECKQINYAFSNVKFDAHMFANEGINLLLSGRWEDTLVSAWLTDENSNRKGLKESVLDVFGRTSPSFTDTFGKVVKPKLDKKTGIMIGETMSDTLIRHFADPVLRVRAADYASLDAYNTKVLCDYRNQELAKINMGHMNLLDFYKEVETEFSKTLFRCERRGVTLDKGYFQELEVPMLKEMREIEAEFVKGVTLLTGEPTLINIASPKQIGWFFYTLLKKPVTKWTKGGTKGIKVPSTDAEVIEKWAEDGDKWARLLVKYREVAILYGTFVTGLQEFLDRNFRIHTNFSRVVTGRLACVDGDTLLDTDLGTFRISELDLTKTPNISIITHEMRERPIKALIDKGIEEMFEVTLVTGHTITCTAKHRFLTPSGWRFLGELVEGDDILYCEPG